MQNRTTNPRGLIMGRPEIITLVKVWLIMCGLENFVAKSRSMKNGSIDTTKGMQPITSTEHEQRLSANHCLDRAWA